ncbi:MAG: HNH endonuclease [Acidimicrobiales bacterium]
MRTKTAAGAARTLLLNASYEPICVVSVRRAVVLVLSEKAEVVHAGEGAFRSISHRLPVPSVIRLLTFVRIPYRTKVPLSTRAVLARDSRRCAWCGGPATTVDHVVPRAKGGPHAWENVVAACAPCNGHKADRLAAEMGWHLARRPAAPTRTAWLVIAIGTVEPEWEPYLAPAAA